jgi:hypothetical protein
MENKNKVTHRVTMALRQDLNERVFKKAEELRQNSNYFVNQCIEGILDAMDADDIVHDIPILKLARLAKEKPLLDAQKLNALCLILASDTEDISVWDRRYFAGFVNHHEGELTRELLECYWRRAIEANRTRIENEKAVARLKKKLSLESKSPLA